MENCPKLFLNYHQTSQLMRLWYLSHRWPAKAQASLHIRALARAFPVHKHQVWKKTKDQTKNQISSSTGWLRMHVWRTSLRRMKSAISHEMEQSDQGLHCLQFPLHLLDATVNPRSNFREITANFSDVQIFRIFTVVIQTWPAQDGMHYWFFNYTSPILLFTI